MHEGGEEESLETPVIFLQGVTIYISLGIQDERSEKKISGQVMKD